IEAFHIQYSRALFEQLVRYAARRVSGLRKGSSDDLIARELVVDAAEDTLEGRVGWDPKTKTLKSHLCDVIKRRTLADWERAEKFPQESIDAVTEDGQSPVRDEVERTLRERASDSRAAENARAALAELYRRAAGDADVLTLIDARAREATTRAEVMQMT